MKEWTNVGIRKSLLKKLRIVAEQIGCTMSKIADKAVNAYLNDSVEDIIEKMKEKDDA